MEHCSAVKGDLSSSPLELWEVVLGLFFFNKTGSTEGWKMASQFRAYAVLAKDLSSVSGTHISCLPAICNSSSRGCHTLFWTLWSSSFICTGTPHTRLHTHNLKIIKMNLKMHKAGGIVKSTSVVLWSGESHHPQLRSVLRITSPTQPSLFSSGWCNGNHSYN